MPITRTATGKLPVSRKYVSNEDSVALSDVDSYIAPGPQSVSENPTKRARTGQGKKPQAIPRKKQGRLHDFPLMPLDILYEIFIYLLPADLVNLSRITKAFRNVLMSRQSAFIWKASFVNAPDVPECPEGMTEPVWADLLFGGAHCHSCNSKSVAQLFPLLRRRACKACKKAHLTRDPLEVLKGTPDVVPFLATVPHVYYGQGPLVCWDEDLIAIRDEVVALSQDFLAGSEELKNALNDLEVKKRAVFDARKAHTDRWNSWMQEKKTKASDDHRTAVAKRYQSIRSRCIALGYSDSDVYKIHSHKEVSSARALSDYAWERIRPVLVPLLDLAKDTRIAQERASKYWQVFSQEYLRYIKTTVKALLDSNIDAIDKMRNHAQAAMPSFVASLETLAQTHTKFLCGLLPTAIERPTSASTSSSTPANDVVPLSKFGALELATSVFTCPTKVPHHSSLNPCLLIGPEAAAHRCDRSTIAFCAPAFSKAGAQAVAQMLRLLGLDASTTTSVDMDGLQPRFVCEPCDAELQRWTDCASPLTDRDFMTWRTCITHALQQHDKRKAPRLVLRPLTDEEWAYARKHCEMRENKAHWGCAHCNHHVSKSGSAESWLYRGEIVQHVQSAHEIREPVNGRDLFYDYSVRYPSYA